LAGSPDGLVGDNDIVEIKYPHGIKDMTPKEGLFRLLANKIKFLTMYIDGKMKLKRNDNYYYQVQGQLRVVNIKSYYFIVWSPKGKHFVICI